MTFTSKIGAFLIFVLLAMAIFAPWISPHDPDQFNLDKKFASPSREYVLGNDMDGRDVLSRIIYGARTSLGIGIVVVSLSTLFGVIIGMLVGWYGGWLEKIFLFIFDIFLAFPSFLFAIAIAAFLTPSVMNIIVILSLKGWVTYARLARGQVLTLKKREFIVAGEAIGVGLPRLFFRHLLPNMMGPIIVNTSFGMAGVIMIESALSFLGLGVPVNTPSWGGMLDQGTQFLFIAPHLSIIPGIFIMLVVMGFNFLGDGLRDKLAPRGR